MAGRSVFIDLIGRDRVSPAFASAAASAERAAGKMTAVNAKMAKAGATLTKGITVPLLAVAAVSTKVAIDYQKSMTLLQTAGGETAKQTAIISKGIQDVAVKTGTSLKDLTEGMYTVAKAGSRKWTAAGQLNVLRVAAEGAKAENVDLGTATNALTSVMMSYHLGASKAVQVQNELVVGAGRAKTTMQSYAGALSTVVPVASAAHISFAQVAGAIATMTQHGTSADEATQELSHTIRNLLSPNQVAQKAMQQLGLSVTDVTKNLGKRGLTGTIDLITNAIAKHMGPAGMVAVSAFKKSQSASADLRVELSKMPKSLQDISSKFASGKMSYKDYYAAVKGLGGQAYVMGKQFITAVQNSKGFNDLLKSGQPGARTFAGTLKNVLGTATSMNTALQLGGDNMAYFKTATHDVGQAAHATTGDVLGWAKTSQTLSVKMDMAKASLQVLALEIGNALIPVVTRIVGWISKAVTWFENLSGTQKAIIGWSLGVLAALGPILTITARLGTVARGIGTFVGGVSSRLASLAGASETQAARVGTAMRTVSAALAGAAIGATVGSFTRDASTTTKWLGALGSAAAGAAIGFSMGGGPIGALIGGAAGGVTALATAFIGAGNNAHAAIRPTQQLTQAILDDNDALGKNVRALTVQSLEQKGLYDAALKLGINQKTLTDAAMGNKAAMQQVATAERSATLRGITGVGVTKKQSDAARALRSANDKLKSGLGDVTQALKVNKIAADNERAANSAAGKNDTARAVALKRIATLYSAASTALKGMNVQVAQHGVSLNDQTKAGRSNESWLGAMVTRYDNLAKAQLNSGTSLNDVNAKLDENVAGLKRQATQSGFNSNALDGLIARYKLTPAQVVTNLVAHIGSATASAAQLQNIIDAIRQHKVPGLIANSAPAKAAIAVLQARIDALKQKTPTALSVNDKATGPINMVKDAANHLASMVAKPTATLHDLASGQIAALNRNLAALNGTTVSVSVQTLFKEVTTGIAPSRPAGNGPPLLLPGSALGGPIRGPGTATSDSIPARLSNGEFVVRASRARKYGPLLNRINSAPGFAAGGSVDTSAVGSAIGTIGQAYTKPIDLSSIGITQVRAQIARAIAVLNQQIARGLSSASATSFRAEIASLTHEAAVQLAQLKAHIRTSDFAGLLRSLSGTVTDTRTALAALLTDASHAGASAAVIDKVRAAETKLAAVQQQRNTVTNELTAATAKLQAAQQQYQQVFATSRQATLNTFDITTAGSTTYNDRGASGSMTGILGNLGTMVANARQFATLLRTMIKNGVPKGLVAQLAAAGPAAMAQARALAAASPAQILQLDAGYGQLSKTSSYIGSLVATDMYGAGVKSAQGLVNGLKSKQSVLNKTIQTIAQGMINQLKSTLGIKSPSRVMRELGQYTGEGYRLGVLDRVPGVHSAGKSLANAATPASQQSAWGDVRAQQVHHHSHTWNLPMTESVAIAVAFERRMTLAGYGSS